MSGTVVCDGQTKSGWPGIRVNGISLIRSLPIHTFMTPWLALRAPFELGYGDAWEGQVPDFRNNPIAACSPRPTGHSALSRLGAAWRLPYTPA